MTDLTFDARTFITAGRAVFTLTGRTAHYTFRVNRSKDGRVLFVGLLTGSDNTADYTYVGVLDHHSGYLRLTGASTYTSQSTPVVALRWALPIVWSGGVLPAPAALMHVGKCGRCGRALTVPSSILAGIGPECATML